MIMGRKAMERTDMTQKEIRELLVLKDWTPNNVKEILQKKPAGL